MTSSTSTDGSTPKSRSDAPAPAPKPADVEAPSAELLEFLGEFGDEIDPIELDEASEAPEPKR